MDAIEFRFRKAGIVVGLDRDGVDVGEHLLEDVVVDREGGEAVAEDEVIGIVLPVCLPKDAEILGSDAAEEGLVAGFGAVPLPGFEEGVVCFPAGGARGKVASEFDPIGALVVLQSPDTKIGPAIADEVGVVLVLVAKVTDLTIESPLDLGIEDVDVAEAAVAAVHGHGDDVVHARDVGHVVLERVGAAVAVGVEAGVLAGLGDLLVGGANLHCADVSDTVGKERLALRVDEPAATVDFLEVDEAGGFCGGSGGGNERGNDGGENEVDEGFHDEFQSVDLLKG